MSQFRSLVFEGGGVKGIAYAGAIEELEARGIMNDITRVGGTSAGAITAALVALGASANDVGRIVGGTQFRKFMDSNFGVLRDARRLLRDFGWFKGDEFTAWMSEQIGALAGNPDLTFGELWALAKKEPRKFRKLYIVATNLTTQQSVVYSGETANVPIAYAARVSMSIPLFFASVREKGTGAILVDGGVAWNYPLDLFDLKGFAADPARTEPLGDGSGKRVYNKETLGLRVDTAPEIAAGRDGARRAEKRIGSIVDYAACLVGFMGDMANRMHLDERDWHRTIYIDCTGVGTTEFNLSDAKRRVMMESGRQGVRDYFKWFDAARGAKKPRNKA